jgi:hypothetical protein
MRISSPLIVLFFLITTNLYSSSVINPNRTDTSEVELLNAKNGVYKTYRDFLKGNSIELNFVKWIYRKHGSPLVDVKARFKDSKGLITDYSCEEFWGFRSGDGFYRTFSYDTTIAKYLCFF